MTVEIQNRKIIDNIAPNKETTSQHEVDLNKNAVLGVPEGMWITLVETPIKETFHDRQKGKLIARVIAIVRKEKRDYGFEGEEIINKDLSQLAHYGNNMSRPLTKFMARLRENPFYTKPAAESLMSKMMK